MTPEPPDEIRSPARQLELGTWGVFFLWIGIALLADLDWGVWLLGVGAIVLGAQLTRRILGLPIEGFWIGAGVLLLLGGVSHLYAYTMHIALIPLLCLIVGAGLIARAVRRGARPHHA